VDSLTGGDEADVFIYTSTNESNSVGGIDTITDFTSGTDKLQFELGTGLTLDYIVDGDFSGDGLQAEARYDGSTLYIDADGNGSADMEINLSNGTDLDIDDFSWT
jgi:Ca2+-binding RTX toxin-like protein